jgi:hypothetical protein
MLQQALPAPTTEPLITQKDPRLTRSPHKRLRLLPRQFPNSTILQRRESPSEGRQESEARGRGSTEGARTSTEGSPVRTSSSRVLATRVGSISPRRTRSTQAPDAAASEVAVSGRETAAHRLSGDSPPATADSINSPDAGATASAGPALPVELPARAGRSGRRGSSRGFGAGNRLRSL